MGSIVEKIRQKKIYGATALIIVLFILWQIGSYIYWETTDDLYDKERVNAVLVESGLDWEVSRQDELGEKMIAYYLKDPKLEPPTLERAIILNQNGRVKYTELYIQNVMGGATTSTTRTTAAAGQRAQWHAPAHRRSRRGHDQPGRPAVRLYSRRRQPAGQPACADRAPAYPAAQGRPAGQGVVQPGQSPCTPAAQRNRGRSHWLGVRWRRPARQPALAGRAHSPALDQ